MATVSVKRPAGAVAVTRTETAGGARRWGVTHSVALLGVVFVAWQTWTWIAWLRAGPEQVTQFRDTESVSWYAAKTLEVLVGVLFVGLTAHLVRRCVRERRLVFDAKLYLAGFLVLWLDAWTNFLAPIWMYSSNFVNLNNPLGFAPGIVNPDMGRMPFPILFHAMNYPVALVMAGMLVSTIMRKVRARWPGVSGGQLLAICVLLGIAFDIAYELPMFKLRLWAFPGTPDELALFGGEATKFPIWEFVPAGIAFASFGALRYFKNDKGEELTERGLEGTPPRLRGVVSTLALVAVVHVVWFAMTTTQAIGGLFADPYKPMPTHLINDMCDAPLQGGGQVTGTRYGPCPEQGYEMPVRKLPGPKPFSD